MFGRLISGLTIGLALQAATISFTPTEQTGSQTANVLVTFTDVAGGIQGSISVNPNASDPDLGDIRAIFFNLINLPAGITPAEVLAAITGPNITATVLDSSTLGGQANVQPLGPFTIGLEFGTEGIGQDDIQSTTFFINNAAIDPDLLLSNLGAVAVRVTSIGAPGTGRGGSGKFLDLQGDLGDNGGGSDVTIPEPSTYLLAGTALAFLAWKRRKG